MAFDPTAIKIRCSHDRMEPLGALKRFPNNPNEHPREQIELLAKIIANQGVRMPIVVSNRSGCITRGHGRLDAAELLGMKEYPIDLQDYDDERQEKADVMADNRIAKYAEMDIGIVKDFIMELDDGEFDLDLTGFLAEEIEGMMLAAPATGLTDPDDVPEPPKDPIAKPGDVWILGDHRLMCGDSGNRGDMERLMAGGLADLVLTDPPYGVAYVGRTKDALTIKSDDVSEEELERLCSKWFDAAQAFSRKGAYWMATVPSGPLHGVFFNDWKRRGVLRQVLVWVKDSMVLGHSEYHYRHEPILFGWIPGGERLRNGDRTKTTVWEFDRPKRSAEHPTMKPVEMWAYAVGQHTRPGDLLLDPFSGSGTTYIACEQTGRKCYGMELDPAYVDVAVKRWEDFTGRKAELDG